MKSTMTIREYENFCMEFFNKEHFLSNDSLTNYLSEKSVEEIHIWKLQVLESYAKEKLQTITELIAESWEDYDPITISENKKLAKQYRKIYDSVYINCFLDFEIIKNNTIQLLEIQLQKRRESAHNIEVNGVKYKAIKMCDVLWSGWDSDPSAWIVNVDGTNKLVTSNHGSMYFNDASFLEEKIKEYESAIIESREMLDLLKKEEIRMKFKLTIECDDVSLENVDQVEVKRVPVAYQFRRRDTELRSWSEWIQCDKEGYDRCLEHIKKWPKNDQVRELFL